MVIDSVARKSARDREPNYRKDDYPPNDFLAQTKAFMTKEQISGNNPADDYHDENCQTYISR
jgi:hypothetical protein